MKKIVFISIIFSIASCSHYVQVYETKTTSPMNVEKDSYSFENDTVRIVYTFWANHGTLSYTVFNKLNVPIYIDWKKSSYVKNSEKLDYWIDIATTKSISKGHSAVIYGEVYGKSYNNSTTVKPEQIIFIAPKSTIAKDQFILYPFSKTELSGNVNWNDTKRTDRPNKDISIKYLDYTVSNSPLIFRNFLTISTSDKFDKEAYIDNGFYISKISEMDRNNFLGNKGQNTYSSPFKKGSDFYIELK